MGARKPLLLATLNDLYRQEPVRRGGAIDDRVTSRWSAPDPGDPGLLTRTAAARLRAADLVLYDALVDERILQLARRAQRFFVGKRAGRHALSQDDIHAVMIRAAKRGRRVVRLKGGDPFVFGRGGEEALALQAAGVPFDVVPGVTSAVAAPALAGIPVTHRGLSAAVLVVSGHDDGGVRVARSARSNRRASTIVVLMGLGAACGDCAAAARSRLARRDAGGASSPTPRGRTRRPGAERSAISRPVKRPGPSRSTATAPRPSSIGEVAALDFART